MFSRQILISGTLVITAMLTAAACSDLGGSSALGPSGLGAPGATGLAALGWGPEYADVMIQGGGGVYAPGGAMLVRQPDGLRASMTVPTPQPGTYSYPAGKVPGHPEVFTLWAFVFNYPNLCSVPCNGDDLGNTPAQGGAYNVGGHVTSGNSTTIAGRIAVGEAPRVGVPLQLPATAEVHLALAPHGQVDPSAYPNEFRIPTGNPAFWWVGMFH